MVYHVWHVWDHTWRWWSGEWESVAVQTCAEHLGVLTEGEHLRLEVRCERGGFVVVVGPDGACRRKIAVDSLTTEGADHVLP